MKQLQPQLLKDNLAYYPLLCYVDVSGLFVVADAKKKEQKKKKKHFMWQTEECCANLEESWRIKRIAN